MWCMDVEGGAFMNIWIYPVHFTFTTISYVHNYAWMLSLNTKKNRVQYI